MLQALIVTLREGVEAALIVGITLAYLTKVGRLDLRKTVYAGLIAAFVGSVAGALILSRLGLNSDAFEGWVEMVAAFFVIGMVIFMMRAARNELFLGRVRLSEEREYHSCHLLEVGER